MFDKDAPLNRIKGETIKANTALMDYFLLGAGRSQEKLQQKYSKNTVSEPPTIHLRTIAGWSIRYQWQARIAQQAENDNAIILEQIERDNAAKLAKWQALHMSEVEALAILAEQARGDMGKFAGVRAQTDLDAHSQSALVKNITQHYTQTTRGTGEEAEAEIKARIALGLYDAQKALELILKHHGSFVNRHELTGKDGGPIETLDLSALTDDQLKRLAAGEDIANILANE